MAYFECIIGSGSGVNAIPLIVTCSQNFAGTTITASKTGARTQTQICPSSSPYEVTFILPEDGTWTISGVVSGQTFSETVTILPYEANLNDIPEGSTVTPTDDIQIWLHCANIWDKTYTTISQVLSDGATMTALIASNNAADYMARSTTWINDVTADSSTMTLIGADDYCSDALLSDSTWLNAICNSTYFESVLNVKVPVMTSATTPSGVVSCSPTYANAFKFFDGSSYLDSSSGGYQFDTDPTISYTFTAPVKIYKVGYAGYGVNTAQNHYGAMNAEVYGDNTKLLDINITQSEHLEAFRNFIYFIMNPSTEYETYRFKIVGSNYTYLQHRAIGGLQFYGRS